MEHQPECARSTKGILMLFEDPNRTSTEEYYNPTKVEVTIEGVPNQLYSKGMLAYQQWDEINKYFALTSKKDKETDKVAKDLNFSDSNIEKYFTTRFALWRDLRSTDDNTLHGSGRRLWIFQMSTVYFLKSFSNFFAVF